MSSCDPSRDTSGVSSNAFGGITYGVEGDVLVGISVRNIPNDPATEIAATTAMMILVFNMHHD